MKKIKFYLLFFSFSMFFACNDAPFLEMTDQPKEIRCQDIYNELGSVYIDKIGKTEYKYEVIDGEKVLVEVFFGSSYTTNFYAYENGYLHSIKRYDRLSETFTDYDEFIYSNGVLIRQNYAPLHEGELVEEIMAYTTFSRDEQNRMIERKSYWVNDGIEELSTQTTFKWDDCNIIESKFYNKEGTLESTSIFFYDDKANPANLVSSFNNHVDNSTNNLIRIESRDVGEPITNSEINEYTYTYNEMGLPIQRRFNEFEKLDYFYIID